MVIQSEDFIRQKIKEDLSAGGIPDGLVTRFPPEPNGFLHIGHAKSICLNFGVAEEFGGKTFLRFDDTNPLKESSDYVAAIMEDVSWLGFDYEGSVTYASDYFEEIYDFAKELIIKGKAYVCSLSADKIRSMRGTLTEPGQDSPFRGRSIEDNLDLFFRMRAGEFPDGTHVLRAKIDMESPNLNLRDPVLYRIRHARHHRTQEDWVIYPMYDFTHCICDSLEGITHSLCTLEFEDHRPLYDWVLENISSNNHPPQIEFSRLGLEYTVMSKRLLQKLVLEDMVDGWNDPRMPTLAGLRRRGVPPEAIKDFCKRVGVTKQHNLVEMQLLDFCIRQTLEDVAPRGMAVLDPLKVVITNHSGLPTTCVAPWHPRNESLGFRDLLFSRELFIDRNDFELEPPEKYKRLSPGQIVRLRYGFIIRCDDVILDTDGTVRELRCTYFPESRSGSDTSGLKPKGVIHWVSVDNALPAEFREYDRLFSVPEPDADRFVEDWNRDSLKIHKGFVEPAIQTSKEERFQFERLGYFCKDIGGEGIYNRVVTLRDSWKPS